MKFVYKLFRWLGQASEDSRTGKPSVKRVMFAMVITFLLGIVCGTSSVTIWTVYVNEGRDFIDTIKALLSFIENIAAMLLAAVTTGYVGGKAVEKKKIDEVTE